MINDVEDRYLHDNDFRVLVDYLENLIEKFSFTPTEVREAAMYACIRCEARHPTIRVLSDDIDLLTALIERRKK